MGRRAYLTDAQGMRLPSVTTILNATRPPEAREALARWRDRLGAAEATRVATTASRRGSQTHKHLRHYLRGEAPPCPDAIRLYWQSLEPVLADIDAVNLVEATVFHYNLGYAGQVDCVANYQGQPCVVDWKTADVPKGSVERLYDGPLQLAAYCGAVNQQRAEGDSICQAMLVVAVPQHPAEVFWFDPDHLHHYWEAWQQRLAQFYGRSPWHYPSSG
ncbi:MAG: PD-(D/E)XK nuclease family protein [Kaiparowitsia implicata GSE-PSE-MK54-09C]|jgi:genome maintenance exonuclease 1|nr:PD-(D/E)XK nuclease family protein [Kaiparowitsia implicata GSE-PSE-MK54-09C]